MNFFIDKNFTTPDWYTSFESVQIGRILTLIYCGRNKSGAFNEGFAINKCYKIEIVSFFLLRID